MAAGFYDLLARLLWRSAPGSPPNVAGPYRVEHQWAYQAGARDLAVYLAGPEQLNVHPAGSIDIHVDTGG